MSNEAREYFVISILDNGDINPFICSQSDLLTKKDALDTADNFARKGIKSFVTKRIATVIPSSYFEWSKGEAGL